MKKLLALLLALTMVFALFSGCSKTEEPAEEPAPAESAEAPAEAPEEEAPPAEEPGVEEAPAEEYPKVDYTLPLFEDTYEFSYFWVMLGNMGGGTMLEKKDVPVWQQIEENLNVKIDWVQNGEAVCSEKYNLMIASGDMTDLIFESNCGQMGASSVYPGGYDKAIEDDVYLDLTDLLPEYAPNYWHYVMGDEMLRRDLSTDSGTFYSIGMIYDQAQGCREGMFVRTDYLEATGLELPDSIEGWKEVFSAMKDNGVVYPFGASNGGDIRGGAFASAFGTSLASGFKIDQASDTLVYDATSQELRDFLEFYKFIWENNMVNPDFMYMTMFDSSLTLDGSNGTFGGMNNDVETYKSSYGMDITACPPIHTEDSNGQPKLASYEYTKMRTSGMKNTCISTNCEEPEKALMVLDWLFSDEGIKVSNYGWNEGESYELVNGEPQLLPLMAERDENGVSNSSKYVIDEGPIFNLVEREYPIRGEAVIAAKQTWVSYDPDQCQYMALPSVSMTTEESEEISSVATDIATKVNSDILAFMTGEVPLNDDTWAEYCANLESMGLDRLTEIYEGAYERYKAR